MSSDIQTLQALAKKTQHDMRYFELVTITNGTAVKKRKCFLAIGKHAVFFLRQNLGHAIFKDGGRLDYAYILNLVKDTTSRRHFMISLGANRPDEWTSERLYVESERREVIIRYLRTSWQTDYMWRLGKVAVLKISNVKLRDVVDGDDIEMKAFEGYGWQRFQDYKFMVPEYLISTTRDGEWYYESTEATLIVQVHEPMTLDQLKSLGRDHIRWVATEYIQNLLQDQDHFYITRNEPYTKRMNLSGDRSTWYAWEIIIKTREITFLAMLLRRQYLPPTCNTAQDIALLLRCPREKNQNFIPHWAKELRCIGNTLSADASTFTVYQDIVQARLDALRYDEEATFWIGAYIKLYPVWRKEAIIFLRKIMEMYIEDQAMADEKGILTEPEKRRVFVSPQEDDEWASISDDRTPMEIVKQMEKKGEGIAQKRQIDYSDFKDFAHEDKSHNEYVDEQTHKWMARVARFFAWAVDGGLVGDIFTLDKMIEGINLLTEDNKKQANDAILFMLHTRDRDMIKAWEPINLSIWLRRPAHEFSNRLPLDRPDLKKKFMYNENVMQALFRMDYVKKMQDDYHKCLGQFLDQDIGINLKAYICRLICQLEEGTKMLPVESCRVLIEPLLNLVKDGGTFLGTHACAALVNVSHDNENVKNLLISHGAYKEVMMKLRTKDDDLVTYVLMLLVNLTKEPHTRAIIAEVGALPTLYDILTSSYHMCGPDFAKEISVGNSTRKEKLLTQVCIVIGQYCNEDNWREQFQHRYEHTVDCLMFIFLKSTPGSALAQQAMFAMKQLCVNNAQRKGVIGETCIAVLVAHLKSKDIEKNFGFLTQAILLLLVLANHSKNKNRLTEHDLKTVLKELRTENKIVKSSDYLRQRLDALDNIITHTVYS